MQVLHFRTSGSLKTSLGQRSLGQTAVQGVSPQAPLGLYKLRRCCVASSSEVALVDRPPKHQHHKGLKVLPRVQYSDSYKELDIEELLDLFLSAGVNINKHIAPGPTGGQEPSAGREELLRMLEHAVANSITIVVASVLEDKLPSYQDPDKEASQASKDDWTWVTARRQRKKKKVLAGFARATGDCALTASIHDVVVLPELQGLGLGRKLLAKATNQVRNKTGITDIGLAANPDSYSFFGKCAFDLDREKSIFMAFAGKNTSMTATDRLQRNTKLLQILDETSNK